MFSSYERLLAKIDAHLRTLNALGCPAGCDRCCRVSFTLFPVEALHLHTAFLRLPEKVRGRVLDKRTDGPGEECLFLLDHRCVLYQDRPVLCRTHGYPFLGRGGDGPDGWQLAPGCEHAGGVDPAPAGREAGRLSALLLDPVNEMLVAVNRLFLAQAGLPGTSLDHRIPVADIPLLRLRGDSGHASL